MHLVDTSTSDRVAVSIHDRIAVFVKSCARAGDLILRGTVIVVGAVFAEWIGTVVTGTGTAPTANGVWASDTTQSMLIGGTANQGGSFEVTFTVTLQPDAACHFGELDNQAEGIGTAVDDSDNIRTTSSGAPATASDLSEGLQSATCWPGSR